MGKYSLAPAIGNVTAMRERLMQEDDNYREAETLYAIKSVLIELDQYFGGGYFDANYMIQKMELISQLSASIHKEIIRGPVEATI